MKRYQFRLEPVLRVRRIEQDTVQAAMAAAHRGLGDAEAALDASITRYDSRPPTGGSRPASAWLAERASIGRTAATVVAAGVAREVAATCLEEQRAALLAARRRVSALERLDERRRDEHALAAEREEAVEVDELVTTRHGRTS